MEIMKWAVDNLNYSEKYGKRFIISLYCALVAFFIFHLYQKDINIIISLVQLLFIIIINIWIYTVPKFYRDYECLKGLFVGDKDYYNEYLNNERRSYIFKLKDNSDFFNIVKMIYTFFWGGLIFYHLWFIWHCFCEDLLIDKLFLMVLITISLLLNFSTYYISMLMPFFYRQISNLTNLKYNMFIPSATYEFVKLTKNTNKASITFLTVALTYNIACVTLLFSDAVIATQYLNIFIACFFIFSFFSFLIVFLLPKFFLHRLLYRWKETALKCFQDKLYGTNNISMVETITNNIERLNNDKVKFGLANIFELVLIITTILYNVVFIFS